MNISQGRRLWVLYKYCDLVVFFSAYIYIYICYPGFQFTLGKRFRYT